MDTSPDSLQSLLREVAPKVLWEFLNPKPKTPGFDVARLQARQMALQGFQNTPASLRLPLVQKRLLDWFSRHEEQAQTLRALHQEHQPTPQPREIVPPPELNGTQGVPPALEDWQQRAQNAELELERMTRLLLEHNGELETLRERLRASTREADRLQKEERHKSLAAQKKLELEREAAKRELAELKKHDDRESRRLSSAQRERDELETTTRALKKQVRHLSQRLDEEGRRVAALEARAATPPKDEKPGDAVSTPATTQEKDKPVKVARPTPLDELFRWMADGHEFRVTPREAMKRIDANDEGFVFRASLALEGVSPQDAPKKTAFLHRLREQDFYYVQVLTQPVQRALVDASNVVRATKNKRGKGELKNLIGMKKELRRLGFFPIEFIADASLRHNIDELNVYNEMINRGEVEVVTPGTEADETLVRKARSGGGYVVTNDAKFHFKVSPDLAPPSLGFRVMGDLVVVEDF